MKSVNKLGSVFAAIELANTVRKTKRSVDTLRHERKKTEHLRTTANKRMAISDAELRRAQEQRKREIEEIERRHRRQMEENTRRHEEAMRELDAMEREQDCQFQTMMEQIHHHHH